MFCMPGMLLLSSAFLKNGQWPDGRFARVGVRQRESL
jgi:hypothetical protein